MIVRREKQAPWIRMTSIVMKSTARLRGDEVHHLQLIINSNKQPRHVAGARGGRWMQAQAASARPLAGLALGEVAGGIKLPALSPTSVPGSCGSCP